MERKRRSKKPSIILRLEYWVLGVLTSFFIYVADSFKERQSELVISPKNADTKKKGESRQSKEDIAKAIAKATHDRLFFDPDTDVRFLELTDRLEVVS